MCKGFIKKNFFNEKKLESINYKKHINING